MVHGLSCSAACARPHSKQRYSQWRSQINKKNFKENDKSHEGRTGTLCCLPVPEILLDAEWRIFFLKRSSSIEALGILSRIRL